ncbi:Cof-type HAD-IIB family hydrolase [Raineyella fluvialis]|uniref:Cof-type HAD-IIB family hydrolase n=1 Tax=Raineyella fluvialis TaxID=2662261 RepID=A0A5Q2FEG5_9ACTN|nr:Cof-type HAD-IIB family hydrolase [Raineyella fluvialis]QGF23473.1 Cof-type HAD-IIB family hydrolase [Raineyella fluvialis]
MTDPRLVFLDVDGTLLDHSQNLAPSAATAIRTARAAGHQIYLCTGRSRREIPATVTSIGVDGVISAGGGFVERDGELLFAHSMPADVKQELEVFFETRGLEYTMQGYTDVYPSHGLFARVAPLFEGDMATARDAVASADMRQLERRMAYRGPAPDTGIAKATFFGTHPGSFSLVRDGLGDRFHVITGTIPYLGSAGGEVSPHGVNKGAAITELAEALNMPLDRTIGIGDSHNDLEMLQVTGIGIAMGNADDVVKSHADETTLSVNDDGVWHAFRRHGLI